MIRKDWPHFPLLKPNFRVGKEFFRLSRKKRITGPVSVNHHSLVIRTDVISPQAPAFTYTCLKMHCTCAVNVKTKFFLTNALMYQGHLHYQIHTKMKGKWHFSVNRVSDKFHVITDTEPPAWHTSVTNHSLLLFETDKGGSRSSKLLRSLTRVYFCPKVPGKSIEYRHMYKLATVQLLGDFGSWRWQTADKTQQIKWENVVYGQSKKIISLYFGKWFLPYHVCLLKILTSSSHNTALILISSLWFYLHDVPSNQMQLR